VVEELQELQGRCCSDEELAPQAEVGRCHLLSSWVSAWLWRWRRRRE